ncbi:MAG: DUF2442 domain-containing protein [Deltaproteobacteria bacterium HGW-Deltaproteobacteria-22]|jgi:hypothetical protein|nr:MAG: DUF2442 domain-containing protein [Deltaproteobacteria bacterium HGW-Deltaproteobacteria-22]
MSLVHEVSRIRFEGRHMFMVIDGKEYGVDLSVVSSVLLNASAEARNQYEVSPSGYGIHWPELDEDLSVEGLLRLGNACESPTG